MATIRVDVTGMPASGANTPSSGDQGGRDYLPADDRLIDEIRQQLDSNSSTIEEAVSAVRQSQLEQAQSRVSRSFQERRDALQNNLVRDYNNLERDVAARQAAALEARGARPGSLEEGIIQNDFNNILERESRGIGERYDTALETLNQDEAQERTNVERELTSVLENILGELQTGEASGRGTDPGSYVNMLRAERRQALADRDNAPDEASALEAQRRVADLEAQLGRATGRYEPDGGARYDPVTLVSHGISSASGALDRGDIGGVATSLARAGVGIGASSVRGAVRGNAIIEVIDAVKELVLSGASTSDNFGDVGRFRSTAGGARGQDARINAFYDAREAQDRVGVSAAQLGLSYDDFSQLGAQRVRASGQGEGWADATLRGVAIERSLGLDEGATIASSRFDRYNSDTSAESLVRLVEILTDIRDSGISENDFSRVQEKFDIQQTILSSYLGRTDRPDYDTANSLLAAFSSANVTQDSRVGSDIQVFQDAIQNPMNDRMQALVYGVVGDLFPETGGRLDLIDRELQNPENEGKILQAVVEAIEQMFGGTDTQLGYFAFKQIFPNIAPDRRDEYIQEITQGRGGRILSGEERLGAPGTQAIEGYLKEAVGYLSKLTVASQQTANAARVRTVQASTGLAGPVEANNGGEK